ncbi:hypothetical protein ACJJTC_005659 [Scirpophaga incertulas]
MKTTSFTSDTIAVSRATCTILSVVVYTRYMHSRQLPFKRPEVTEVKQVTPLLGSTAAHVAGARIVRDDSIAVRNDGELTAFTAAECNHARAGSTRKRGRRSRGRASSHVRHSPQHYTMR